MHNRWVTPASAGAHTEVCVVAPAGRVDAAQLAQGAQSLLDMELALPPGLVAWPSHRHFAAPLKARIAELGRAQGPIVWTARGGSGSAQVLAALPADFVLDGWLVGFSDITTLHARQQAHYRRSLHAANVTTLPSWSSQARQELGDILRGRIRHQRFEGTTLHPGSAQGPIVGGNLTVLASLVGSGLLPDWRGAIVLFEDIAEAPYRLERALMQLVLAGQLDGVGGIVLGQMSQCGSQSELGPLEMFAETFAMRNIPVVAGLPVGHGSTSRALVLGAEATLTADEARLELLW